MMLQYDWPGNVRELKNAIERAVVMGDGAEITPEDMPISSPKAKFSGLQLGLTLEEALNAFKKEFIKLNLGDTGGNRSKAAKVSFNFYFLSFSFWGGFYHSYLYRFFRALFANPLFPYLNLPQINRDSFVYVNPYLWLISETFGKRPLLPNSGVRLKF